MININIKRENEFVEYGVDLEDVTLLEVLIEIKTKQDVSLVFSSGCRSSVCGSCSMRGNEREVLACSYKVQDGDTIEEIRQNSISQFATQMRNVTADDYLVRALSMPPKYGVISKALTQKPNAENANTTLDLYVLTNDLNNKLTTASDALKNNLRTYINQYRMIGDTISIKDAFIINFGIQFEVITYPNFNSNEVIERCIIALQDYFIIDKWQLNQPIIVPDLFVLLDALEGVQTVRNVILTNIAGATSGYSQWAYDMDGANQNGTIFPSLDPSIFELKYPNVDIKGRVVNL